MDMNDPIELSDFVKSRLTYDEQTWIMAGQRKSMELQEQVEEALGVADGILVTATNQAMIYGPPGVGKTFTTRLTCESHGLQPIEIGNDATASNIIKKFAYAEYYTPPGQSIVVIWDDADKVVFGSSKDSGRWKNVFQDEPEHACFNYDKNIIKEIEALQSSKELNAQLIGDAMRHYMPKDSVGVNIPMERFKHIFLTNYDYEVLCQQEKRKWMWPIISRFKISSLEYDDTTNWGWLSLVLLQSQPFERFKVTLSEEQKVLIIRWMWDNWTRLKLPPSYRTVKLIAADIVNRPTTYMNKWQSYLKPMLTRVVSK